jgi:hypothetical protein
MKLFKRNKFKGINYLDLIPVRKLNHEFRDEENIDILVPKYRDKFFGKFLQPKINDKYLKANMDIHGTNTWLLIDGERNVFEISKLMKEKFGDEIEPVYDRITLFINNLYRNGFIYFKELTERNENGKQTR